MELAYKATLPVMSFPYDETLFRGRPMPHVAVWCVDNVTNWCGGEIPEPMLSQGEPEWSLQMQTQYLGRMLRGEPTDPIMLNEDSNPSDWRPQFIRGRNQWIALKRFLDGQLPAWEQDLDRLIWFRQATSEAAKLGSAWVGDERCCSHVVLTPTQRRQFSNSAVLCVIMYQNASQEFARRVLGLSQ